MSSSRSCRILTISSSIEQGKTFIERIVSLSNSDANPAAVSSTEIPWTISNKYYTAPVHFLLKETQLVESEDVIDVPACVFVFSAKEPFRDDFNALISRTENSDFEISIAVSVPTPGVGQLAEDDHFTIEAFFGEHGFEYVNGLHTPFNPSSEHDVDDMEGIPGIGRVVDALSTILWPSMVQIAGSGRTKTRSVISVPGPPDEEESLPVLLNADKDTLESSSLQREMAALERWLEEGADDKKDPWEGHDLPPKPTSDDAEVDTSQASATSGFDDNFSDFISASGEAVVGKDDDDDDPALPSREEIELTSRRIFSMGFDEIDGRDAQASFDLSRVLGALEAMKDEISGIADEEERRKAAAKVALGLVYGLEGG